MRPQPHWNWTGDKKSENCFKARLSDGVSTMLCIFPGKAGEKMQESDFVVIQKAVVDVVYGCRWAAVIRPLFPLS